MLNNCQFQRHQLIAGLPVILAFLILVAACSPVLEHDDHPAPKDWSTADDHRDMMRQLGITALRPGPSGNPDDPDFANTDEALANPYPDWPPLLETREGRSVTTAQDWWRQRRPAIVEAFEREVVGRLPAQVPSVDWSVLETLDATMAGHPVVGRQLVGQVDNSDYPPIDVTIDMTLVLPGDREGPVPIMIMFGGRTLEQSLGLEKPPRFGPPLTEA